MKKNILMVLALLLVFSMMCTSALAQGSGDGNGTPPQGGGNMGDKAPGDGQGPDGGQGPSGDQMMGEGDPQFNQNGLGDPMNINTEAITLAISQLEDEDLKAELTALLEAYETAAAGDSFEDQQAAMQALRDALSAAGLQVMSSEPMNLSYNFGREYGRFLDVDKVAEAIGTVTDEETLTSLTALLEAYQTAVESNDPAAVKDALEALMAGLEEAQLEVDEYTGLQLYKAAQGIFLDTAAVETAIGELEDSDTIANLTALLDAYKAALSSNSDIQTTQIALTALLDALEAAGITI